MEIVLINRVRRFITHILLLYLSSNFLISQNNCSFTVDLTSFYGKNVVFNSMPFIVYQPDESILSLGIGSTLQVPVYKQGFSNISLGYSRLGTKKKFDNQKRYLNVLFLEGGLKYYLNKWLSGKLALGSNYLIKRPNDVPKGSLYRKFIPYYKADIGITFFKHFELNFYVQPFLSEYLDVGISEVSWEIYGIGLSTRLL